MRFMRLRLVRLVPLVLLETRKHDVRDLDFILRRATVPDRCAGMSSDAGAAADTTGSAKTPADFLKSIRGRPVVVKLNSGVDYRGE